MVFIPNPFSSKATNLKRGLRDRTEGKRLFNVVGDPTARDVIDLIVTHNCTAAINAGWSYDQLFGAADQYITADIANILGASLRLANLVGDFQAGLLGPQIAGPNILAPANYHVAVGDNAATQAAKWICNSSNTLGMGHLAAVRNVLQLAIAGNLDMENRQHLLMINNATNLGAAGPAFRGVALPPGKIPSSPSGAWLLNQALILIHGHAALGGVGNPTWRDLACYLLGAIIRCHGYTDGNGRTARAAYAICVLRGGGAGFDAPTVAFEQTLHGL